MSEPLTSDTESIDSSLDSPIPKPQDSKPLSTEDIHVADTFLDMIDPDDIILLESLNSQMSAPSQAAKPSNDAIFNETPVIEPQRSTDEVEMDVIEELAMISSLLHLRMSDQDEATKDEAKLLFNDLRSRLSKPNVQSFITQLLLTPNIPKLLKCCTEIHSLVHWFASRHSKEIHRLCLASIEASTRNECNLDLLKLLVLILDQCPLLIHVPGWSNSILSKIQKLIDDECDAELNHLLYRIAAQLIVSSQQVDLKSLQHQLSPTFIRRLIKSLGSPASSSTTTINALTTFVCLVRSLDGEGNKTFLSSSNMDKIVRLVRNAFTHVETCGDLKAPLLDVVSALMESECLGAEKRRVLVPQQLEPCIVSICCELWHDACFYKVLRWLDVLLRVDFSDLVWLVVERLDWFFLDGVDMECDFILDSNIIRAFGVLLTGLCKTFGNEPQPQMANLLLMMYHISWQWVDVDKIVLPELHAAWDAFSETTITFSPDVRSTNKLTRFLECKLKTLDSATTNPMVHEGMVSFMTAFTLRFQNNVLHGSAKDLLVQSEAGMRWIAFMYALWLIKPNREQSLHNLQALIEDSEAFQTVYQRIAGTQNPRASTMNATNSIPDLVDVRVFDEVEKRFSCAVEQFSEVLKAKDDICNAKVRSLQAEIEALTFQKEQLEKQQKEMQQQATQVRAKVDERNGKHVSEVQALKERVERVEMEKRELEVKYQEQCKVIQELEQETRQQEMEYEDMIQKFAQSFQMRTKKRVLNELEERNRSSGTNSSMGSIANNRVARPRDDSIFVPSTPM